MSPIDPETVKGTGEWIGIAGKLVGYFFTFVSGIVAATAVIVRKVSGYDARIEALENSHKELTGKIDNKLDRLHQRMDDLLLTGGQTPYRHEKRDE